MKISLLKIYTFLKIKLEIAGNVGFFWEWVHTSAYPKI